MTALEIVLISLLGAIVCLIAVVVIINAIITRFFSKKVVDYEVLNEFAPKSPIVFLGDSLTDLYPMHEFLHDDRIINRGISNETCLDVEKRLGDIIALSPKTVFLLVGINDYVRAKRPPSCGEVAKRIVGIADKLSATCGDVRIISLYPVNPKKFWFSKYYLKFATNERVTATNAVVKKLCIEKGYKYLDYNAYLIDDSGKLKAEYTVEGLHLNLAGYKVISPLIKEELENII